MLLSISRQLIALAIDDRTPLVLATKLLMCNVLARNYYSIIYLDIFQSDSSVFGALNTAVRCIVCLFSSNKSNIKKNSGKTTLQHAVLMIYSIHTAALQENDVCSRTIK